MKQTINKKHIIYSIISCVILIIIDQVTKLLAIDYLKGTDGIDIIAGVFKLQYLENMGAAFGILQNRQSFFIIAGVLIIGIVSYLYISMPFTKRFLPLRICFVFLIAGAIGNMIDRIYYDFVVDFLYFELIDFPIFNVADMYVTVTMFVIVFLILFYYKDDEIEDVFECFRFKNRS